jgi:hypothetical protein
MGASGACTVAENSLTADGVARRLKPMPTDGADGIAEAMPRYKSEDTLIRIRRYLDANQSDA